MSDLKKYEGVIPAFYACYDDQGEVSPERTRALVQYSLIKVFKVFMSMVLLVSVSTKALKTAS